MRYFFYGTLIDRQVLRAVLRRSVGAASVRLAVLGGYRRVYRCNASYPMLVPDRTAAVDGLLVSGLTTRDAAFLRVYEGSDYHTAQLPVRLVGGLITVAAIFLPGADCAATTIEWRFEEWRRRFRAHDPQRVIRRRRAPAQSG